MTATMLTSVWNQPKGVIPAAPMVVFSCFDSRLSMRRLLPANRPIRSVAGAA